MKLKRTGIVVGILLLIGLVLAFAVRQPGPMAFANGKRVALAEYNGKPTGTPADFQDTDPLAKGRYLTVAADCEACHTRDGGAAFAGGRPFETDFGTIYSPNITPDAETGIGSWSDADFLRAVHEGIAKDGTHLYPAFPYAAYTHLTDEDVLAMKAYLFSLPAVKNTAPREYAALALQPALADGHLVEVLQPEQALRAGCGSIRRMEPRRPISPRRSVIAVIATRRARRCRR